MSSPDIIDFYAIPSKTLEEAEAWVSQQINYDTSAKSFPKPGDAGGWKYKDWVAFSIEWGLIIEAESAHSYLVRHPLVGVVGSFPKTPSDHRSYMNALADIRRNLDNHRRILTERIVEFGQRHAITAELRFGADEDGNGGEAIDLRAFDRERFFDLFVNHYAEVFGESDVGILSVKPDTVREFLALVLKIQRKFNIHPRALMNQTKAVVAEHVERIVQAVRGPIDAEETLIFAAGAVTEGGLQTLQLKLQELEDEKAAKRNKSSRKEPPKIKTPSIKDQILAEMRRGSKHHVDTILADLGKGLHDTFESVAKIVERMPGPDEMKSVLDENIALKKQIEEQAREILRLRKELNQ